MGLEVHCINSGQGNSVALRLPDDSFMVVDIDCHGDTPVDPVDYLKELVPEEHDAENDRYVRRLACAAFTHPHQDHISGLKPLADEAITDNFARSLQDGRGSGSEAPARSLCTLHKDRDPAVT